MEGFVSKFNKKHFILKSLLSIVISIIIIILTCSIFAYRQYIYDQLTVWRYKPTSEISGLADRSGLNDNGKFLYYASQPTIEGTQNFNLLCNRVENVTSILGCYTNNRIYIYDVKDERLDGIREVTTTHETLHAAYSRMSDSEKAEIDSLIEKEYLKLENRQDFKDRMAFYDRTEPGQRDNELHSVIGTEIADISPELEAHYKSYFSDRQKIIGLNNKYSDYLQANNIKVKQLADQLNSLIADINTKTDQYNTDINDLNIDINSFNYRANNQGFMSQSQFDNERIVLSNRVYATNALRLDINNQNQNYNSILAEYNSIAAVAKQLYDSMNSNLAPVPSL